MRRREEHDEIAHRRSTRARSVATALAILTILAAPAGAARMAPGEPILDAAESARAVVAGIVSERRRLDDKGYAASLRVERTIAGKSATPFQVIVWEEPSATRAARLTDGDRILVALDGVPNTSLWQSRLPAGGALFIAASGYAFIADPGATTLDTLAAYLQLAPVERSGSAGSALLADLVTLPDPVLAAAALSRLQASNTALPNTAVAALERKLLDEQWPLDRRIAILELAARRRMLVLRPTVEQLALASSGAGVAAIDTLGHLDGGLSEESVEKLLDSDDAPARIVGARFVRAELAEKRLPELARRDSDVGVRAEAAAALAATHTSWGLAAAVDALADPAPPVRSAAAQAIARLGAVALPALDQQIDRAGPAAPGAIATLALMGPVGGSRLAELAKTHADERLRNLALLALGQVRDEHDH